MRFKTSELQKGLFEPAIIHPGVMMVDDTEGLQTPHHLGPEEAVVSTAISMKRIADQLEKLNTFLSSTEDIHHLSKLLWDNLGYPISTAIENHGRG
jgi:hypothetical protein